MGTIASNMVVALPKVGEAAATVGLPVQRTLLRFEALSAHARQPTPAFAGNAWRSALGPALRLGSCRTGAPDCAGCPWRTACDWAYLYDTPTPPDAQRMRLYPQVPHPYVLRELPRDETDDADDAALMLTLFGRAATLRDVVVAALALAAQGRRGIDGRRLRLVAAHAESTLGAADWQPLRRPAAVPPEPLAPPLPAEPRLRIELTTPLRVKTEGRTIGAPALRIAHLLSSLLRRLSNLSHFHAGRSPDLDFVALTRAATAINAHCALDGARQHRFSQRQRQSIPMDGVVGAIEVATLDIAPWWPLLWLGQYVHAGSATTMGLGHYELRPLRQACEPQLPAAPAP